MSGHDLQAEALAVARKNADAEFGVAVACQLITVNGKGGGPPGDIPAWLLIMTMTNPADLLGDKLRHMALIGNGAPDLLLTASEVRNAMRELRTLARKRVAASQ